MSCDVVVEVKMAKIHHFPAQKPDVNCHVPPIPHL